MLKFVVMPAQAGIQKHCTSLGSRLRGNDESGVRLRSVYLRALAPPSMVSTVPVV